MVLRGVGIGSHDDHKLVSLNLTGARNVCWASDGVDEPQHASVSKKQLELLETSECLETVECLQIVEFL